jgi:hypothetical protein
MGGANDTSPARRPCRGLRVRWRSRRRSRSTGQRRRKRTSAVEVGTSRGEGNQLSRSTGSSGNGRLVRRAARGGISRARRVQRGVTDAMSVARRREVLNRQKGESRSSISRETSERASDTPCIYRSPTTPGRRSASSIVRSSVFSSSVLSWFSSATPCSDLLLVWLDARGVGALASCSLARTSASLRLTSPLLPSLPLLPLPPPVEWLLLPQAPL